MKTELFAACSIFGILPCSPTMAQSAGSTSSGVQPSISREDASSLPMTKPSTSPEQAAPAETTIGDIVVTAQRRSETVQRIPLAVSAVTGASLQTRGVTSLAAIGASVPGLNVSEQVGQARLTLRGIGVDNISAGAESSVAFNQDNVFYSRSAAALASFYDVDRVEVLRGPQGTLYGRNATGGSVNILTNRPSDVYGGGVSLTVGNYETIIADGFVTGPVADAVSARLSFQIQHHSGYGKNIITGSDIDNRQSQAVRGQVLIKPDDRLQILLAADYYHSDDASNSYHYFGPGGFTATGAPVTPTALLLGGIAAPNRRDTAVLADPTSRQEFYGARADISYQLSNAVTLRSLTAYRHSDFTVSTEASPISFSLFPLTETEKSNQYTQEFQLNVDTGNNKLVAGVFYLHEKIDGAIASPFNLAGVGGPPIFVQGFFAGGKLKTDAVAGYAQDTYSITPKFRLTVGARYSWEKKRVDDQSAFDFARLYSPTNPVLAPRHIDSDTFKSFTPKVGIDFDLAERTLVYASFSKGFKSGTYNLGSAGPSLRPEKVDAYEAGIKSTLFDGLFRANLAGFYYDYTDLQVGKVQNQLLVLENAATARIYGVEGEFTLRPTSRFTVNVNASWLHARFRDYITGDPARPTGDGVTIDPANGLPGFDLRGKALPQAPNYTVDLGAEYRFSIAGGSLTVRGESSWSDRVYFTPFNRREVSQAPYSVQNAFLTYEPEGGPWRLSFYARNIANKTIAASGQLTSVLFGSPIVGFLKPPRTIGGTFALKY